MALQIPKRFKLMGYTVEVVYDGSVCHRHDAYGVSRYRENQIVLQPEQKDGFSPVNVEQTFCHELVHFISARAGAAVNHELKEHLHRDEEFVDLFASLLHQALTTMEFDEGKGYGVTEIQRT